MSADFDVSMDECASFASWRNVADMIDNAGHRATPELIGILRRYPRAPEGKSRLLHLMMTPHAALEAPSEPGHDL